MSAVVSFLAVHHGSYWMIGVVAGGLTALAALVRRDLLIFLTAALLMAHQTHFAVLRQPLEQLRWLPFFLFLLAILGEVAVSRRVRRLLPSDFWILGWVAFAFLSAWYSVSPMLSVQRAGTVLLMYGAIFWAIWSYADRRGEENPIRLLMLAFGVIHVGGLLLLPLEESVWHPSGRFRGLLENPNSLGLLTAVFFPIAVGTAARKGRFRNHLLVGLMALGLILSGSRGGTLAALIGSTYVLWRTRGRSAWLVAAAAGVLVVVFAGLVPLSGGLTNSPLVNADALLRPGTGGRLEAWPLALDLIKERPILGYGFGTEELLFPAHGVVFREFKGGYFHNSYLGLMAQVGLFGALAFFLPLFYLVARQLCRARAYDRLDPVHSLLGSVLAGLAAGLSESWMYSMGNAQAFPFWTAVMLLIRRDSQTSRKPVERGSRGSREYSPRCRRT